MLKFKLIQALAPPLNVNVARLKTLCSLIEGMLRHRTVNLTVFATTYDGKKCSNESRYRRFQDFFLRGTLPLTDLTKSILSRLPKPKGGYLLAIDRTNWQFGKHDINVLVIAIIVGKVSIPVAWKILPKKTKSGNSNAAQRKSHTRKLPSSLPAKDIKVLTLDRDFIGKKWLKWLDDQSIPYIVRIKKNVWVGKRISEDRAHRPGRVSKDRQEVFGLKLYCKRST